jgi:mannose-6-phosphate isomerase-like protein (cupin superfamily)
MHAFDTWPEALTEELAANQQNGHVGGKLVSETDTLRIWHLHIPPGERLGFHRHVLNYFWTALVPGRARSHYGDGRIADATYAAGDTKHFTFDEGQSMIHDLQNIGSEPLVFVTVEFKQSANQPLTL